MPSSASNYHDATKYDPQTIGGHPGLDWEAKPALVKEYAEGPHIPLSSSDHDSGIDLGDGDDEIRALLARTLYCLYGTTAMMKSPDGSVSLRSAPSAGGLYPAELYVLVREVKDIPVGIYNYHIERNELQLVRDLSNYDDEIAAINTISRACGGEEIFQDALFIFFFSSIYYRSSWRYHERGYRRCLLDTGHLIGNLRMVVESSGDLYPNGVKSGFVDEEINQLLNLDGESEGVLALGYVCESTDDPASVKETRARAFRSSAFAPVVEAAPEEAQTMLIHQTMIHRADLAMALASDMQSRPLAMTQANYRHGKAYTDESIQDLDAMYRYYEEIPRGILQRRSGRHYTGEPITFRNLLMALKFAYMPEWGHGQRGRFAPELLDSWLVVHNVQGLPHGIYAWAEDNTTLYLIEEGDFRREMNHAALGQEIASRSSAVLIHSADLENAVQRHGNRAYRTLHMDAGIIAQRMAVISEILGFRTCGIGGFFDDQINQLLSLSSENICVYMTTIGREN